jgi:hypothetical protein
MTKRNVAAVRLVGRDEAAEVVELPEERRVPSARRPEHHSNLTSDKDGVYAECPLSVILS